jgi:hypothetical protein
MHGRMPIDGMGCSRAMAVVVGIKGDAKLRIEFRGRWARD